MGNGLLEINTPEETAEGGFISNNPRLPEVFLSALKTFATRGSIYQK